METLPKEILAIIVNIVKKNALTKSKFNESNTIAAVPSNDSPDKFIELDHGYILTQRPDGSIIVSDFDNNGKKLTYNDKIRCLNTGLKVSDFTEINYYNFTKRQLLLTIINSRKFY